MKKEGILEFLNWRVSQELIEFIFAVYLDFCKEQQFPCSINNSKLGLEE